MLVPTALRPNHQLGVFRRRRVAVTSVVIEQIEIPASSRQWRAITAARERVADVLAGRTVWCAAAIPS